jgi:hypothetical protein
MAGKTISFRFKNGPSLLGRSFFQGLILDKHFLYFSTSFPFSLLQAMRKYTLGEAILMYFFI